MIELNTVNVTTRKRRKLIKLHVNRLKPFYWSRRRFFGRTYHDVRFVTDGNILVFWTLLKVAWLSGKHDLAYGFESFDESPAIYFESLGKAALYNTDYKTIVYLPLRPLSSQINITEFYFVYIERLCSRADIRKWTACRHLDDLNIHQVEACKRYRGAGQRSDSSRSKRVLLD